MMPAVAWFRQEEAPPILKSLYDIILSKKSILCVAADVTRSSELLQLIHQVGPYICILKTHIDIIEDFSVELLTELKHLADKYNFLIFEDRKFADIGHTVKLQYGGGIYRISEWAHLINCHPVTGVAVVEALQSVIFNVNQEHLISASEDVKAVVVEAPQSHHHLGRGLLLISDMSSMGFLGNLSPSYKEEAMKMALSHPNFVVGWISQSRWHPQLPGIVLTPGISLEATRDSLGQQYTSPKLAIANGADIIIVGRSIIRDVDPSARANTYRQVSWDLYMARIEATNIQH